MSIVRSLIVLTIISVIITACSAPCIEASGDIVKEKRAIQGFEEIELRMNAEVELVYSPATKINSVLISANENLLPYITTRVTDGKLVIDSEQCLNTIEQITMVLPIVRLTNIENHGSGRIVGTTTLPFTELDVLNSGSGNIDVAFKGADMYVENEGSGVIAISGGATELKVLNQGSGEVVLSELMSNAVKVRNNGSGNVSVWAEESIDAELSGSGSIGYKGRARNVSEKNEGSGNIYRTDAK